MKFLLFIILILLVGFAIYYLPSFYRTAPTTGCPSGSRYVRSIAGGGWADTNASDPWGTCVSEATINGANNQ